MEIFDMRTENDKIVYMFCHIKHLKGLSLLCTELMLVSGLFWV
jgi:hypothetical protein